MLLRRHNDLTDYALTDVQLNVLSDIRDFLAYAHAVQELVSAEHTPTLSVVLPLYEKLIEKLKAATLELPKIAHAIDASINKLEEYLAHARTAKIYNLAIGTCL